MQVAVLLMRRGPIAQALGRKLNESPDTTSLHEPDYARAAGTIACSGAGVALIEVGETSDYGARHCLDLCRRLRKCAPCCKLVLMCPEQDEAGVCQMIQAKKGGQIDDFVFYDASLDYLSSKLLSML